MPTPANASTTYKSQIVQIVEDGLNVQYGSEAVAANTSTAQTLGTTGAAGDYLYKVTITATGAGGSVAIIDGSTTLYTIDASSANIGDIYIIDLTATTAWKITTGADVAILASGTFT